MRFPGTEGRRFFHLMLFVIVTAVATALAQAPPQQPLVTVIKIDGTTVRGRLTNADPKVLSVTPIAKPKTRTDPEQLGAAVEVAWAEVKSVSNGLTRQRAIELWKKQHPEDFCDACRGSGKSDCGTCRGTGRDPAAAKDCPSCHGTETAPCAAPKCDKGIIPCPRPCLKPTDAGWYKKPDGKLWRRFPMQGGYREISDGHLGQIVDVKTDAGPVTCPTCKGEMKIKCPTCGGDGIAACPACIKAAKANPCAGCKAGQVECKTCTGLGLKSEVLGIPAPPATSPAT